MGFMLPSVRLRLNQKLMLSMELMAMVDMATDTVLDTVLTLLDMDMDMVLDMATLPLAMVMVWDMPGMDMASVLPMLSQRLMLSMELMVDTVLDTVLTLLDMVDMAWDTILMVLDMDTLPLVMVMVMDVDMASMDKQQIA